MLKVVVLLFILIAPAAAFGWGGRIFAAGDDMYVCLPETLEMVGAIKTGELSSYPCTTPDGRHVLAPVYGGDSVKIIDTEMDEVVREVVTGKAPYQAACGEGVAVVCNSGGGSITLLDTANFGAAEVKLGFDPWFAALSEDGKRAFVAAGEEKKVAVINIAAKSVERVIDAPAGAYCILEKKGVVYLESANEKKILMLNAASFKYEGEIITYGNYGMGVTPDGRELWFGGPGDKITAYDLIKKEVIGTMPRDNPASDIQITFSRDGKNAYVVPCGIDGRDIYAYDVLEKEIKGRITLPSRARGIALVEGE